MGWRLQALVIFLLLALATQGQHSLRRLITGPVVSGFIGVKKCAYDIWGDTVNPPYGGPAAWRAAARWNK